MSSMHIDVYYGETLIYIYIYMKEKNVSVKHDCNSQRGIKWFSVGE